MPKIPKTKSEPKETAGSNTVTAAESELRRSGRRLRLYFSNERLEKLEYIASHTETNRPRILVCDTRNGSGQFRWCGYSRALAVVLLLAKTNVSANPKVLGKKARSAVSSFLDVYDNGSNAFNKYPLFQSENTASPESAMLNQVFYSNKGNDKNAEARWVGLDTKRLAPDCIEVWLAHVAKHKEIIKPQFLRKIACAIEQQAKWTASECEAQNPGTQFAEELDVSSAAVHPPPTSIEGKTPADASSILDQLRPPLSYLVGRERELDRLCKAVRKRRGNVVSVWGMPGVGKTTFALALADALKGDYPDGCIFFDMCGYGKAAAPLTDSDAMRHAVRSIEPGLPPPVEPQELAGKYFFRSSQ